MTESHSSPTAKRFQALRVPFAQAKKNLAQAVGIVSVFFICTSILTFCLKTHPDMRVPIIHNLTVRVRRNIIEISLKPHPDMNVPIIHNLTVRKSVLLTLFFLSSLRGFYSQMYRHQMYIWTIWIWVILGFGIMESLCICWNGFNCQDCLQPVSSFNLTASLVNVF